MDQRVIVFSFSGRRQNLAISMPLLRRILDQHPNTELHLWNFCRNVWDNQYLQTISGERISVHNQYYNKRLGWQGMNIPFRVYANPKYRDCVFVKVDDDVVFLETERFGDLIEAITENPGVVISAKTINNGASTRIDPNLWKVFEELDDPNLGAASPYMKLLDVHLSNAYGEAMHHYMFEHHRELIGEPIKLIPTDDWLSINAIGYDYHTACKIGDRVGRMNALPTIAHRNFPRGTKMGDEGYANTLPRLIMQGFLACHLTFGPQDPSENQLALWRVRYAEIAAQYLEDAECLSAQR